MSHHSKETREARRIERLYSTKANGCAHSTVIRLLREQGTEGCLRQLEAWGMRAGTP